MTLISVVQYGIIGIVKLYPDTLEYVAAYCSNNDYVVRLVSCSIFLVNIYRISYLMFGMKHYGIIELKPNISP